MIHQMLVTGNRAEVPNFEKRYSRGTVIPKNAQSCINK